MQLGMLWVCGFVRLAAGPIRAASECTGVLRKSGMQLGMLWIFGFETGQRTAERRVSCGDGPTHRGIPGDHLVGTPFGGWGSGTMLGLPRPLHPGTFAPRPHPYILLYIVLTGRCRVQRVQKVILLKNP